MKRKIWRVLLMACLVAVMLTSCSTADENHSEAFADGDSGVIDTAVSEDNVFALTSDNVKLCGRTWLDSDVLWLALSGSGIEFEYTGKGLDITVIGDGTATSGNADNQARIAICVDGQRVVDDMVDEAEHTYTVAVSEELKTSIIKVIKLSECTMSVCGIKNITANKGESIVPALEKSRRIEFIGDSITCGYGVDDEVKEHGFKTSTEDCTKAYAYKTAQLLNADCSLFSISGYGIISGYTNADVPSSAQTIPQYYESLGFSYGRFASTVSPDSLEWDFDSFRPDLIVVNLGTNDASYTGNNKDKQGEYAAGYIEFLKTIRERNPDSTILCTLGIMDDKLNSVISESVITAYINETGDENIDCFIFDIQNGAVDGYAADWHPTEATHDKAAEKLVAKINELMGW